MSEKIGNFLGWVLTAIVIINLAGLFMGGPIGVVILLGFLFVLGSAGCLGSGD